MRGARVLVAVVVTSAVAAVGCALWLMTWDREETWFFAPSPLNGLGFVIGCGLLGLVWTVTGAVVVLLRPRNALGWIILGVGASQAWAVGLTALRGYGLLASSPSWGTYFGPALYLPGWLIPPTLLLAFYPDGRLPARWWRWPVGVAAVSIVILILCIPFPVVKPADSYGWVMVPQFPQRLVDVLKPGPRVYDLGVFLSTDPTATIPVLPQSWARWSSFGSWVSKPLLALSMLTIWVATVVRMVRAGQPQRQQLALLVCVVMPFLAAALFVSVTFANVLVLISLLLVPMAVAVGVLRYRLLGIEAVLRSGLVYGTFTVLVVTAYLLATAAAGVMVGAALDSRPLPGIVAAAAVAVALAPARDWLQRTADRLVYGHRHDPLRALTELGQQVTATGQGDLLSSALRSVTTAMHASGGAIITPDGRTSATVGDGPVPDDEATVLPLRFGGDLLGELRVLPRRPGEPYSAADARLLAALALQLAVVVRAHQLTEQLERARDRVVTAAESERDRLRADLHDGLGPSLSGIGLGLQALADALESDRKETAIALLRRIQDEVPLTLAEVRRIIAGLRPSALDKMTLPEAIRRQAATMAASTTVDVAIVDLPALSAPVENAVYRIFSEALNNVTRHAGAGAVDVRLVAADRHLVLTVVDDGGGGASEVDGFGLSSMRRRAEDLGGHLDIDSGDAGTTIVASIPLEQS